MPLPFVKHRPCPGATLLWFLMLLSAWGCSSQKRSSDLILHNGKVITVDSKFSVGQAVAIKDGKIVAVGEDEDVLSFASQETKVIDLEGKTVVPGLIEGHAHPVPASQSEFFETIPVVNTISELLEWIRAEAVRKQKGAWIIHPKFFVTRLHDKRQVTLRELDAASPDNPVFLNGSYGGMVNSQALEASGLTNRRHPGVLRDNTGRATGQIRRSAFSDLALPAPTPLSEHQKLEALANLLKRYNSVGFTSVCSGGGTVEELAMFKALRDSGALTVRIFHNIRKALDLNLSEEQITEDLRAFGIKTGDGDEWVRVGAYKVVLDGGMLTGTAFLHEAWGQNARDLYGITDPAYRGELMYSKEQLVKVIGAAVAAGWKFTAHVTGGAGVDTLLAAYESVHESTSLQEKRFSIIHGNFFTSEAIAKMKAMGIYADMQPAWFLKDTELLLHVLGQDRMENFHPYRSLTEAGVVVNAGSDHMVKMDPDDAINPYNPFTAMWSLVTRKTSTGNVYFPSEAVSRQEALKMYTIYNAMASFEERLKGSIEPGKLADLVVLSDDLMTCPEDSIRFIRPLMTIVDGKIIYQKQAP